MSYPKRFVLAGVLAIFLFCLLAHVAAAQVFSGEGRAQLGPNTTPRQAKELAFQLARRNALRKFGVEVRSRQKLQSASSSAGYTEMTESEIATLAVGDVSLVEGSKQTSRRPTEETVVYTVTARFDIDPPNFEKTLEAYQNAQPGSELKESVSTAVEWQSRLEDFDEKASELKTQELLAKTRSAYNRLEGSVRDFDSGAYERQMRREGQRKKNAARRYLSAIQKHGFPSDMVQVDAAGPRTEGRRSVEMEYRTRLEPKGFQKLRRVCKRTARRWEGMDMPGRPPNVERPVRLLMLSEDGRVLLMMDKANARKGQGPSLRLEFRHCSPRQMYSYENFDGIRDQDPTVTWKATMDREWFTRIDKFVVAILREDYRREFEKRGYSLNRDNYVWVRPSEGEGVKTEDIVYTRSRFQSQIQSYVSEKF